MGRSFEPGRSVAHAHADVLAQLVDDRLLELPPRLPPHVADISALASWMAYSNLLNRIDLQQMETHHGSALG